MEINRLSMDGKVAFITGASSGLGRHFAKTLSQAGAKVIVGARRGDKLKELVDEIKSTGATALAVDIDVMNPDSVKSAFDEIEHEFGGADVLVNNAGMAQSKSFLKVDEASWDAVVDTNLKGVWQVGSEFSRRLIARNQAGSIVNLGSILGLRVSFGESVYSTTKAAVIQMTKAMALELAPKNIRVNALCPGYFKTEMNAAYFETVNGQNYIKSTVPKRLGKVEELDVPLLLLSSDAGAFITGIVLPVDGGHLIGSL